MCEVCMKFGMPLVMHGQIRSLGSVTMGETWLAVDLTLDHYPGITQSLITCTLVERLQTSCC